MKTQLFVIIIVSLFINKVFSQTDVKVTNNNETLIHAGKTYRIVDDVQTPISYSFNLFQKHTTDVVYEYINNDKNGIFVKSITPQNKYQYPGIKNITNVDTLFVSFNVPNARILVIDSFYVYRGFMDFTWLSNKLAYIILNSDHQFNIGVFWMGYSDDTFIVFEENYTINGTDTLEFNTFDAIYEIDIQPLNENGISFNQLEGLTHLHINILVPMNLGYFSLGLGYPNYAKTYLSELSSDFFILYSSEFYNFEINNTTYFIEFPALSGINQNHIMVNQPEDYIHTNLQMYITDEQVENTYIGLSSGLIFPDFLGIYIGYSVGVIPRVDPIEFWNGEIFLINQENDLFRRHVSPSCATKNGSQTHTACMSPFLEVINDSICGFYTMQPPFDIYKVGNNDTMFFGESPTTFKFWWRNNNSENDIFAYGGSYGIEREFIRPSIDLSFYNIRDNQGNIIFNGIGSEFIQYTVEPGNYSVDIVNFSCPLSGGFGISQQYSTFNIGADDASPPSIDPINFRNNLGKPTYKIGTGEELTLLFSSADFNDEYDTIYNAPRFVYQPVMDDSTKVFIKENKSSIWQEIYVEKYFEDTLYGSYYKSDLSAYTNLDSSALDLKISIQDYSGNTSEFFFRPVILIDDFIMAGIEIEPFQEIDFEFSLYPNPATSIVNLQVISSVETEVIIYIFDINGVPINSIPERKIIKGKNNFSWNMFDKSGLIVKSGVYFCVLEIDNRIIAKKLIIN